MRYLLAIVLMLVAGAANAQANFVFNGAGQSVGSSATVIQQRLISGSGLTWAVGDSGSVARATAAANASLYSQGGQQIRLAGAAVSRVAANDLAAAAISGIRGGLVGVVASTAIQLALSAAKERWDAAQQSMIYNPDPVPGPGPGGCTTMYKVLGEPDESYGCSRVDAVNLWATNHGGAANAGVANSCADNGVCQMTGFSNGHLDQPISYTQQFYFSTKPGTPTATLQCPNGVNFNDTQSCAQPVSDSQAADYMAPKLTGANAPQVAGDITNAGGSIQAADFPSVQLNPAGGPTVTTQNSDGTSTQSHTDAIPNCVANKCAVSLQNTSVQLDANGNPVGSPKVVTTSPGADTPAKSPTDDTKTCGLTQGTACKIDEEGTTALMQPAIDGAKKTTDAQDDWLNKLTVTGGGGGFGAMGIGGGAGGRDWVAPDHADAPGGLADLLPNGGNCQPLQVGWRNVSLDVCPIVNALGPCIDWFAGCLTALAIWAMFRRAPAGQAGA